MPFQPLDLSTVYRNAEAIKGMRSQTATEQLQREYLRDVRIPNEQAGASQAAAQEGRAAQVHAGDQSVASLRLLNAFAAEASADPRAVQRWLPQLKAAGIPVEQLGPIDQATAKQLFDSTSKALQAYQQSNTGQTSVRSGFIGADGFQYNRMSDGTVVNTGIRAAPQNSAQFRQIQLPDGRTVQGTQDPTTGAIFGLDGAMLSPPIRGGGGAPGVAAQPGTAQPGLGQGRTPEDEARAVAAATATGKATAERQFDLPRLEQNANQSLKIIDDLKAHPGLPYITGLYSKAPIVPGTDQAAADALAKQIAGATFLEAYNTLKGGGQITEAEGTKATEAIGRLSRAQSTEDYIGALDDLRSVISNGLERARRQAVPQSGGGTQGFDAEYNALPSGSQYTAPDGSVRTKR